MKPFVPHRLAPVAFGLLLSCRAPYLISGASVLVRGILARLAVPEPR